MLIWDGLQHRFFDFKNKSIKQNGTNLLSIHTVLKTFAFRTAKCFVCWVWGEDVPLR